MNKTLKIVIIAACVMLPLLLVTSGLVGFSNQEVTLRNAFKQKITERTAFYDKMWKTMDQKSQIALKNDSSFKQNVDIIMSGRKDAQGVVFKWITESNPNANYSEVAALYKDLSRSVEAERAGFFVQEKYIQDVVMEHDNLLDRFPGTLWNTFMSRKHLVYNPITSDRTDEVMKTGKDNDTKLF
jgi:hypothetical protein